MSIGKAPYSGRKAGKPSPRDVLALVQRKCQLRAEIVALQEKIDIALPHLDQPEMDELLRMMASEIEAPEALADVCEEMALANDGVRPHEVTLTRPATQALLAEARRRLSAGRYCPPTQLLVAEAIRAQFERE